MITAGCETKKIYYFLFFNFNYVVQDDIPDMVVIYNKLKLEAVIEDGTNANNVTTKLRA